MHSIDLALYFHRNLIVPPKCGGAQKFRIVRDLQISDEMSTI